MSEVNDAMIRSIKLFKEYLQIDAQLDLRDAKIAELEMECEPLNTRADEISMILAPALRATGPLLWTHDRVDYMIRLGKADDLIIQPLKSFGVLASAMVAAKPQFDAITDAALHAAAEDAFGVDPDDTGEFPPVKPKPQTWPRRSKSEQRRIALQTEGRQVTIQNGVTVIDQEVG